MPKSFAVGQIDRSTCGGQARRSEDGVQVLGESGGVNGRARSDRLQGALAMWNGFEADIRDRERSVALGGCMVALVRLPGRGVQDVVVAGLTRPNSAKVATRFHGLIIVGHRTPLVSISQPLGSETTVDAIDRSRNHGECRQSLSLPCKPVCMSLNLMPKGRSPPNRPLRR